MKTYLKYAALVIVLIVLIVVATNVWKVETAVPQAAAAIGMVGSESRSTSNLSCRMVMRLSTSGGAIRIRLSNFAGTVPVTFDQVYAGIRATGAATASNVPVTFGGATSVTIPAGQEATSDRVRLLVSASQDIAVSVYMAGAYSNWVYGWPKSLSISTYCTAWDGGGNHAAETSGAAFIEPRTQTEWLAAVDVYSTAPAGSIVVIGDSITDGVGSTVDGYDRWTDVLITRLLSSATPKPLVNVGISGGACVNANGWGPTVLNRLDREVFGQSNVSYVIVLIGINDLAKNSTSTDVINCLQSVIGQVHAQGLKILIGTIIPLDKAKNYWWTSAMENDRQQVNTWIRNNTASFDGLLDFDAVVRDPAAPAKFKVGYDCGDGIHPSPAGYAAMANSIDLALLGVTTGAH